MRNNLLRFIKQNGASAIGLLLILSMAILTVPAQQRWTDKLEQKAEGRKEARDAANVFREIMSKPDKAIPRQLLEKAYAVGVFPNVVKAAFVFGGRGGDGVVARRTNNGWSVPVFYNVGGGSFGAQIGAKKTDYIMLFMNEGALRDLLDDKLEFEGDLSFAAGPIGRTLGAGTNLTLDAGILTYSRSKGAFIGASIRGAVLTADNSINKALYDLTANEVLTSPEKINLTPLPHELKAFSDALVSYGGVKNVNSITKKMYNQDMIEATFASIRAGHNRDYLKTKEHRELAREVRKELLMMPSYSVFDWIEFEVEPNGVVVLKGYVTAPPDKKSRAEERAKTVQGVKMVVNGIRQLPVSPADERLRRTLSREIYAGQLFRYQTGALQQIHIVVNRRRVALEGVVSSAADKNLAGIRAQAVSGLFSVDNNLVVRSDENRRF